MRSKFFLEFTLLYLVYILVLLATDYFILTEDVYISSFKDKLSFNEINDTLAVREDFRWILFLSPFFYLIFKFGLTSICLNVGSQFHNLNLSFSSVLRVLIRAEFVFIIPPTLRFFKFYFLNSYQLIDFQNFQPLSIYAIFDLNQNYQWLNYLLQVLSVFEVIYWFILALLLRNILGKDFVGSLGFVASTYGIGLLLWVVFVMFLTISLS